MAVLALATGSARAPQPRGTPSAQEIVARNRVASGADRRPSAERETWLARSDGLSGTLEVLQQGSDSAATLTLGPFRSRRGILGGRRWHQNDNGETVIDAELAREDRGGSESVTRAREPVDAWVVTTTFANGRATRAFYDARTFLLVRTEKSGNGHTTRTSYDDFRTDARGRTRAAHFFGSDERPETDFDFRLERDDARATVAESDVAIPANRRTLVEFPAGVAGVRLPARVVRGRIYVRLTVAGRALDFLLDSGAAHIVLDDAVARSLGLAAYGRTTQTVAGNFATQRVIVPNVAIGPLAMHDVVMRTGPIAIDEGAHTRVVGLLGFDFFADAGLKIDYAAGTVDAARPGTMLAPAGAVPLELRLSAQVPVVSATVDDSPAADFIVDTGAEFDAVLFPRFVRTRPESGSAFEPDVDHGRGIGGAVAYRPLALRRMTLGALTLTDLDAALALAPNALGVDAQDGLIGAGILERFSVYLDYASNRLLLVPGSRAPAAPLRRRSGTRF
jgi:hypothetical protein